MSDKDSKISREKGIEICADLLYAGLKRKDIIQSFTEKYKVCESSIDKWMKVARPLVEDRQKAAEVIRTKEDEVAMVESAKRLNITKERVLDEYAKIAFFDPRKLYNEDGSLKDVKDLDDATAGAIASIESTDETDKASGKKTGKVNKVRLTSKKEALDGICRVMGYNAPVRQDNLNVNVSGGNDSEPLPILINNVVGEEYLPIKDSEE